jgi:cell pole-organizing protein PopZ
MDEILSSIRQIIADDEPQQESAAPSSKDDAAAPGGLASALDEVNAEGEATTIEVEDGPHPDIEAAPIEKRDVAAEALAEAGPSQIEPDGDAEEPLALSIDQMLKPSNSNAEPDPADDELIADPGEVVPTPESDLQGEEMDMASLLLQETAGQDADSSASLDDDAKSIEDSVPDDVAQVVPDDIAFINDDDVEEQEEAVEEDSSLAGMGIDELPERQDESYAMTPSAPEPKQESPLPDKGLSDDIADSLLEPTAQAASSHAFSQLDNLIMSQKQGQTIEDLIREMLRPMLKAWLDENLPGVVEQLVQREIERVSRGKR